MPAKTEEGSIILMERWGSLDLRRQGELDPYDRELIALYIVPRTSAHSEGYAVGRLEVVAGHTWMYEGGHTLPPAKMCKHYDLLWVRLPEDGDKREGPNRSNTATKA